MQPLFTVALVGPTGEADPLTREESDWRPDRLRVRWRSSTGLAFTEFRYVLPGGRFCSAWRTDEELGWPNPAFRDCSLVAFTAAPGDAIRDVAHEGLGLRWGLTLEDRREQLLDVEVHLSLDLLPPRGHHAVAPDVITHLDEATTGSCCGALRSEGTAEPDWNLSPFVERWQDREDGALGGALTLPGVSDTGSAHLVTVLPLRKVPARYGIGVVCRVVPIPAGSSSRPHPPPAAPPMPRLSEARWREALESFPRFSCSDAHLSSFFDYRVYGLHLNRLEGGLGRIPHPAVAGGIDYFHLPIARSTPAHMWESRWCSDPNVARGSLLNFLAAQRNDGSLPGRLFVNHQVVEDFYHANWGDAALAVDALHPQRAFLETAYGGLSRYAEWMRRERDPEESGMVTVVNHYETGEEFMSRYLAVDPESDVTEWEPRLRLKGVDVTVYAYQLYRSLEAMATALGYDDDVARWSDSAERTGTALLDRMWDAESGFFTDVDGSTGMRTGVRAAVGFYPLLTDLLDRDKVLRILHHLNDPMSFGTPFPVPSSPVDDPLFSAEGLWKGKRHNRPWNGRVWPTTNSHVLEGLLRQWHRGRTETGPVAARLLGSFVRMMFHERDPGRPNSFEHYNPISGHASAFRGIDDHQHSWALDLLLRGVVGLEPHQGALRVHPLPMDLDHVAFRGRLREHDVHVTIDGDDLHVSIDGQTIDGHVGEPLEVPW
jgi:hypothetical protein